MEIPIFPLNGAVLFPGTSLPLNIFENRYIEMVNYSLARKRFIGMIQTDENNKLYNIGCVGKIHSFNETNDGRYLISLQGTNCFKINKELDPLHGFRLVDVKILESLNDNFEFSKDQRIELLEKYKKYINIKKINLDLKEIETIDTLQIIKFIAMVSPFKDIDKQALLETINLRDFYGKLDSILDLEIAGEIASDTIN